MNLLDTLQAASNTAASNVSGPVDLIAWTLRKLGLPIPAAPVGSSDWMAQKGLTRPVEQGASQVVGDTIGLLSPAVVQQAAPKIAAGLLKAADNAAAPRTLNPQTGAIVWHGSPHKFDKFDSSKIGTGEGAQAYGHGLYLAESDTVAKSYSGKLSSELKYNGRPMARESGRNSRDSAAWALYLADGDKAAAKASGLAKPELIDALDPAKLQPGGQLYKVDLPDEKIARMLDWDAPLSQQATIKQSLQVAEDPNLRWANSWANPYFGESESFTGARLIDSLKSRGAVESATQAMRRAGIPGIKYLDGGSRGAGTGTRNFVVFPGEEEILKILERNGVPLIP